MRAIDIIAKKRDGAELAAEEIDWFIQQYTAGEIPDYQAAAWLMAVYIRGMTRQETVNLTLTMTKSGDQIDLSDIVDFAVDKHSSGGVGDKTTLVVTPIVSACGITVAKMSGRGLGHTGGTLDKLESITGYTVELDEKAFKTATQEYKIVVAGQSANLAPADKLLYALRDVTATVNSIPLIASSIMSKKLASGADGIVLDVKMGTGAFMSTLEDARELAQTMVNIGVDAGRKMVALISDMNQPLGFAAGNALEVKEAIETLHNRGPEDFREHCVVSAAHMLRLATGKSLDECRAMSEKTLADGSAFQKFRDMVKAQRGDVSKIDAPETLPFARIRHIMPALQSGYIQSLDALAVGNAVVDLGGGRLKKSDKIDYAVGVITHVKVGDYVEEGDRIFTIHANATGKRDLAKDRLSKAVGYSTEKVTPLPLFYDTIYGD